MVMMVKSSSSTISIQYRLKLVSGFGVDCGVEVDCGLRVMVGVGIGLLVLPGVEGVLVVLG